MCVCDMKFELLTEPSYPHKEWYQNLKKDHSTWSYVVLFVVLGF